MTVSAELELRLLALRDGCAGIAEHARALRDDQRRRCVIFAFQTDDTTARSIADEVARASGLPLELPPCKPGALAFVCPHGILVHALRTAGIEVSDPEDPGGGRMCGIAVVNRHWDRWTVVVDAAAAERDDEMVKARERFSAHVLSAFHEGMKRATPLRDEDRRCRQAIVVCDLDDPKACDMARALSAALGEDPGEPRPGHAALVIAQHGMVTNLARSLDYEVPDLPDPPVGHIRTFAFTEGRAWVSPFRLEDELEVARREEEFAAEKESEHAYCARILAEKEHVVLRAVSLLVSDERLRREQIVVVFGARTELAVAVYRELAALPANRTFPPELPPGVPVVAVSYEAFLGIVRRREPAIPGIEASALGPNQARAAVFTPRGLIVLPMESTPLARGGSA